LGRDSLQRLCERVADGLASLAELLPDLRVADAEGSELVII
jgi:hypothetical protein